MWSGFPDAPARRAESAILENFVQHVAKSRYEAHEAEQYALKMRADLTTPSPHKSSALRAFRLNTHASATQDTPAAPNPSTPCDPDDAGWS